ncbi:MAG: hypothetical protein Fur0010_09380 [Bdellovibrio sp.]
MPSSFRLLMFLALFLVNFTFVTVIFAQDFDITRMNFYVEDNQDSKVVIYVFRDGFSAPVKEKKCERSCNLELLVNDQVFVNIENLPYGTKAHWGGQCGGIQFNRCYFKVERFHEKEVTLTYSVFGQIKKKLRF